MSAATRYGDDANLPPPTRVAETPEAEGSPEATTGPSPPPAYATVADVLDGLGRTPEAHIRPVPHVTCSGCGRQAACVRMLDGTVYRPFAWTFPDAQTPRVGLCGGCTPHEPIWRYGGPD